MRYSTKCSRAVSEAKFSGVTLKNGDQVRLVFPGGGGFGNPRDRDPELVRRDIELGFISKEAVNSAYGVGL